MINILRNLFIKNLTFLLTCFFLIIIFQNGGNFNIFEKIFVVPQQGHRYLTITVEIQDYIKIIKLISILLLFGLFSFFVSKIFVNYKKFLIKENAIVFLFFTLIILSYLFSFYLSYNFEYIRKIIICFACLLTFLFFSQIRINYILNESVKKALGITIVISALVIIYLFISGGRQDTVISFFSVKTNSVSLIFLSMYIYLFINIKKFREKIFFFIITFFILYFISSRLGIILLIFFIFFEKFISKKNINFLFASFFTGLVFYVLFFTHTTSFILEHLNFFNFIKYPYSYLEYISTSCIDINIKNNFNVNCDNSIFYLAKFLNVETNIFNLLNSVFYRLSYNYEVINLIFQNDFLPFHKNFNELSELFVTDIGMIRHNKDLFVNPHNSFHIILMRTTIIGLALVFLFLFQICKNLIKFGDLKWFLFVIILLPYHIFDDFLLGNHWASSIISWMIFGIAYNKKRYV